MKNLLKRCGRWAFALAMAALPACGAANTEAVEPAVARASSFDPSRYISDDADVAIFVDREQLRESFYGPYIRRLWDGLQSSAIRPPRRPHDTFDIDACSQYWLAVSGLTPVGTGAVGTAVLAARGACAKDVEQHLPMRVKKLGDDAFVAIDAPTAAGATRAPTETSQPLRFETNGAAVAVRLRPSPALRDMLRSKGGAALDALDLEQLQIFMRVDAGLAVWAELAVAGEARAEVVRAKVEEIVTELRRNPVIHLLNLDPGLRVLSVTRKGTTVALAFSMTSPDSENWVTAVDLAAKKWAAAGGAEGMGLDMAQRLTVAVGDQDPLPEPPPEPPPAPASQAEKPRRRFNECDVARESFVHAVRRARDVRPEVQAERRRAAESARATMDRLCAKYGIDSRSVKIP